MPGTRRCLTDVDSPPPLHPSHRPWGRLCLFWASVYPSVGPPRVHPPRRAWAGPRPGGPGSRGAGGRRTIAAIVSAGRGGHPGVTPAPSLPPRWSPRRVRAPSALISSFRSRSRRVGAREPGPPALPEGSGIPGPRASRAEAHHLGASGKPSGGGPVRGVGSWAPGRRDSACTQGVPAAGCPHRGVGDTRPRPLRAPPLAKKLACTLEPDSCPSERPCLPQICGFHECSIGRWLEGLCWLSQRQCQVPRPILGDRLLWGPSLVLGQGSISCRSSEQEGPGLLPAFPSALPWGEDSGAGVKGCYTVTMRVSVTLNSYFQTVLLSWSPSLEGRVGSGNWRLWGGLCP